MLTFCCNFVFAIYAPAGGGADQKDLQFGFTFRITIISV